MSAGHPHAQRVSRDKLQLPELLKTGGAPEMLHRFKRLDVDHDIHDLAGYNVLGTVRYLDRDVFKALTDPEYATKLGIGPIDTGLSAEDTIECLMMHEAIEKALLDADNTIDTYDVAHEWATVGEHVAVEKKGSTPRKYEEALKKAIAYCEKKKLKAPAVDLACAPMLDDPTIEDDKAALKQLAAAGNLDASKVSKKSVGYTKSTKSDQCRSCTHWQGHDEDVLTTCELVAGLVRLDRWCKKFKASEHAHGQEPEEATQGNDRPPAGPPAEPAAALQRG